MRILLLEDLQLFHDGLLDVFAAKRATLGPVEIVWIASELEFQNRLPDLIEEAFDIAIFDVMVCWCSFEDLETEDGRNPPKEVVDEMEGRTRWRVGLRCQKKFYSALKKARRPLVPYLFYTVLDKDDLELDLQGEPAVVITKQGNLQPLLDAIWNLTARKK